MHFQGAWGPYAVRGGRFAGRLGRQSLVHLGGDLLPNPKLGEIGLDQGMNSQKPDHRQRLDSVPRAKTKNVSADSDGIDHETPQVLFYFYDSLFLHRSAQNVCEMSLRADMT